MNELFNKIINNNEFKEFVKSSDWANKEIEGLKLGWFIDDKFEEDFKDLSEEEYEEVNKLVDEYLENNGFELV